jgi:hypothetical protein
VNTLIDSGCTGVGCIDRFLVAELQLCCERLPQPQPLCLADSAFSSFLTYFVIIRIQIGPHVEDIALAETVLSRNNPIILGFPWLAHHKLHVD